MRATMTTWMSPKTRTTMRRAISAPPGPDVVVRRRSVCTVAWPVAVGSSVVTTVRSTWSMAMAFSRACGIRGSGAWCHRRGTRRPNAVSAVGASVGTAS